MDWTRIDLVEDWTSGKRVKSTGEWTLWYENPGPSPESPHKALAWIDRLSPVRIEIATTGLIASETRCTGRTFVMATDVGDRSKSLIECDYCCPEPKRGIATTSETPPNLVERLDPEGEDTRRIATQILETFNELENYALHGIPIDIGRTIADYLEPRLSSEKRIRLPLRFDAAYRIQGIDTTYYYIEVKRNYYGQTRLEYPAYGFLQGWVHATADEVVWMKQDFSVTDLDMKGNEFATPVLFWRRGNVVDVLVNYHMFGRGGYSVFTMNNGILHESVH